MFEKDSFFFVSTVFKETSNLYDIDVHLHMHKDIISHFTLTNETFG